MSLKNKIGVLGGTFDPPHIGHLKISNICLKKLKLKKVLWAITKKSPLKKSSFFSLKQRIKMSKDLTKKEKKIKVFFIENRLNSNKTINLVKYLKKRHDVHFIIGSDNLVNFHKWHKFQDILKTCKLVVLSRKGFDKKAKKSVIMSPLKNKKIIFIKNKHINVSSTSIRKHLLHGSN